MAQTHFKGQPVAISGNLPALEAQAPDFVLTRNDLSEVTLADYAGQRLILNIVPSLDTPVCLTSLRRFNETAAKLENTRVLTISLDLPFAQARSCAAEGIDKVETLSAFRSAAFGEAYGVRIESGALKGLLARAVVVLDGAHRVRYTQLVPEIAQEPDYDRALSAASD